MTARTATAAMALLLLVSAAHAQGGDADNQPSSETSDSICLMLESASRANGLPVQFFARLIHQESSFRADATGPVTRSGARAQGIAQFMPGTAAERNVLDPYDPVQALPKSAEFLRELRAKFGNLGLAAAAYNAGPKRVEEWIEGHGSLPAETQNYVLSITGRSAEEWAGLGHQASPQQEQRTGFSENCRELTALLRRSPAPFMNELEQRVRSASTSPWGVQLSAGFSRARVLAAYSRIERSYRGILSGRDPIILRALLRSRGSQAFYQVRVGASDRNSADALCLQIRRAGGACMVLHNQPGTRRTL